MLSPFSESHSLDLYAVPGIHNAAFLFCLISSAFALAWFAVVPPRSPYTLPYFYNRSHTPYPNFTTGVKHPVTHG